MGFFTYFFAPFSGNIKAVAPVPDRLKIRRYENAPSGPDDKPKSKVLVQYKVIVCRHNYYLYRIFRLFTRTP